MAFAAFLKLTTVPGESTDDKYKDHIEILSYSHALSQPSSGSVSTAGGRTAERCDHGDFSIVKALDKASPKLALACCKGETIKEATLFICRAGGDQRKYMEYKMSDVIVSSVRPGGSSKGGETLPLEEVSFAYGKIEWTYTILDPKTNAPKGDIKGYWDLHTNKGG